MPSGTTKRTRRISGNTYTFYGRFDTKRKAEKVAGDIRSGYLSVRVVRTGIDKAKPYEVFTKKIVR